MRQLEAPPSRGSTLQESQAQSGGESFSVISGRAFSGQARRPSGASGTYKCYLGRKECGGRRVFAHTSLAAYNTAQWLRGLEGPAGAARLRVNACD